MGLVASTQRPIFLRICSQTSSPVRVVASLGCSRERIVLYQHTRSRPFPFRYVPAGPRLRSTENAF